MNFNNTEFNKIFPNFEKQFQEEMLKTIKQKEKQEFIFLKNKFITQYPNISFHLLQKQNDNYSTNDECIHYKHNISNKIYSWNYIEKVWIDKKDDNNEYNHSLIDLFD
jgi:hypothetical protein